MNDEEQVKRCFQCPSLKMSNGVLKCSREKCIHEQVRPKTTKTPDKETLPTWSKEGFRVLDYIKHTEKRIGKGKWAVALGLGIFIVEKLTRKKTTDAT